MEEIFISVLQRISDKMPELLLVDEDYGQLDDNEDGYPVTFPCALLGNTDVDWNDIGVGVQKGQATIMVKLAIDCYDDTHIGSGTEDKIRERVRKNVELYKALQGFRVSRDMSPMKRVKGRDYSLPGGIKVYETVFGFNYHDNSAAPQ